MKLLRFLVMAALVAMPLMACDDDEGGGVDTVPTGTISGSVTVEGAGVAGVSVTLVGATSQSATTDAGGAYSFASVEAGSYGVAISDFPADVSFSTVSKTTSITTSGQVATVDFSGSYIRTASISGSVTADGAGLAAVAVTMTGPEGAKNAVTDAAGNYSTSGLRSGDYTVTIEVPAGYIFANNSFDVSVGVGQATNVSFVGEAEVTVDPVTAQVVISSVEYPDGEDVDPNDIEGQIQVNLQVDPGENNLDFIRLRLEDSEGNSVIAGEQDLGSGVAPEFEQLQGNVFSVSFTVVTDEVGADGTPTYVNDDWTMFAVLGLVGAVENSTRTSMNLTFDNSDRVMAIFTPEFQEVVDGEYVVGGMMNVQVMPGIFSGKTLSEMEVCFDWDCFTVEGPFPVTEDFVYLYDDYGFDDYYDEAVWVGDPVFSDGTLGSFWNYAHLAGTDESWVNFDYEPAWFDYDLELTDQVDDIDNECCAQNWVGPDYMPVDGMDEDDPYDDLVGVSHFAFFIDAYDDLTDDNLEALIDDGAIDFTTYATVAADGMMADAGLDLSLNNDAHDLCVVAWDLFGQWDFMCLSGNGASNDTDLVFGYDNTAPATQTVSAQPPEMVIYNIADAVAGIDLGGLNVSSSEDRSGFSPVPFRGYVQWEDADDTEFLVAQDSDDGGPVNLELPIESCNTTGGVMPCYPDWSYLDGVFYIAGAMNNQAGVQFGEMVEGWVFNDQTAPQVNANVSVPNFIFLGQPASFSVPVEDNLHLGSTAFGFQLSTIADVWFPLGGNIPNSAGDTDPWDGNYPTEETASMTMDPAIMGVQLWTGAGFGGAPARYNAVRAIHTDGAGNTSGVSSNNILATSFDEAPTEFDGDGIVAFSVTEPSAAVFLCNAQGEDECDDDADEFPEIDLEIVAEGAAGTFANPFLTGELYIYLRTDGGVAGAVDAGDELFIIDILDAGSAVITDEGAGGSRFYTWEYTITGDQVAQFADGTNVYVHVMGLKYSTGTALLDAVGNANITVIDHK